MVLPLYRGPDVHEQLHQPVHLRRKVSSVPDRRDEAWSKYLYLSSRQASDE